MSESLLDSLSLSSRYALSNHAMQDFLVSDSVDGLGLGFLGCLRLAELHDGWEGLGFDFLL